jgi:hypothetical protein
MNLRSKVPEATKEIFKDSILSGSRKELAEVYRNLDPVMKRIREMEENIHSGLQDPALVQEISDLRQAIYLWIRENGLHPDNLGFSEKYAGYIDKLQSYIDTLPESLEEEQSRYRFLPLPGDGWFLRIRKKFKYLAYRISVFPQRVFNFFLRIFRKNPRSIRYWKHHIPVRSIVSKVYLNSLLEELIKSEKNKYQGLATMMLNLKEIENQTDVEIRVGEKDIFFERLSDQDSEVRLEKLKREITSRKRKYSKETGDILNHQEKYFLDIMDKAGTLEFPDKFLDHRRLRNKFDKLNVQWLENRKGWHRTIFALTDDWLLDLEINQLKYVAYRELFQARKRLEEEKMGYQSGLSQLAGLLKEIEIFLQQEGNLNRKKLQSLKISIHKKVENQILPEILNRFDSKTLTGIIRQMEILLEKEINSLSESRALVKTEQYQNSLKEQEINYIKPNELLSFEVFPEFLDLNAQLKNSVFNRLETVLSMIPDVDDIVVFSLDTVIQATGPDQERISSENNQIIRDGLQRAKNRMSEIEERIVHLFTDYDRQIIDSTLKLTARAVGLMQNENALAIRLKLLKAKAIAQTKSYREKLGILAARYRENIRTYFQVNREALDKKLSKARRKYFLHPSDAIVTQEISEFLNESEKSIHQLPVIYRRLYKVEPVSDMDLFIGRKEEFETIKAAYQHWSKGGGSSVAIIGEKWGGLSSLINFLSENIKFKNPQVRICPGKKHYRKDQLLELLVSSLKLDPEYSQAEIIEYLINQPTSRIIIIEDIQHLYLRSIDGFNALLSLIDIIKKTQKDVFWVVTCTRYAWNYLVKSIQIHDYFHRVVEMKSMAQEEITQIIRKRNQIGGFRIEYIPPEDYADIKKFKTASEEEQQKMLENRFFRRLNDFASSNISMALIFWLLSTRKVTDDHIYVGDFNNPDHSFIQAMNQTRIFILLALILHDGLSLADLSRVNNQTTEEVGFQLSSLEDDGIIVRQSDLYMVNSLIYRNVVSVLKSKNLIH